MKLSIPIKSIGEMMYGIRLESTKKISYIVEYGMAHPLVGGGIVIDNHVFLRDDVFRTLDELLNALKEIMTKRVQNTHKEKG